MKRTEPKKELEKAFKIAIENEKKSMCINVKSSYTSHKHTISLIGADVGGENVGSSIFLIFHKEYKIRPIFKSPIHPTTYT